MPSSPTTATLPPSLEKPVDDTEKTGFLTPGRVRAMLVLLVVGAMSLWGMAALAMLVLAEKVLRLGAAWRRYSGALLIAGGLLLALWPHI